MKDHKSFLIYTDNHTGPGHYNPSKQLRKSPSVRFALGSQSPQYLSKAKRHLRSISEDLAPLVTDNRNHVNKVNAAKPIINDILSTRNLHDTIPEEGS